MEKRKREIYRKINKFYYCIHIKITQKYFHVIDKEVIRVKRIRNIYRTQKRPTLHLSTRLSSSCHVVGCARHRWWAKHFHWTSLTVKFSNRWQRDGNSMISNEIIIDWSSIDWILKHTFEWIFNVLGITNRIVWSIRRQKFLDFLIGRSNDSNHL